MAEPGGAGPPVDRRGPRAAARGVPRRHDLQDPVPREPGPDRAGAHAVGLPQVLRRRRRAAARDPARAARELPAAAGHQGPHRLRRDRRPGDPTPPRGRGRAADVGARCAKHPAAGPTPAGARRGARHAVPPSRGRRQLPRHRHRPWRRPRRRPAHRRRAQPPPAPTRRPRRSAAARRARQPRRAVRDGVDHAASSWPSSRSTASCPSAAGAGDLYGDEAVEIAAAAGGFLRAGVDARHLRAWRTSAEREAGLYEQLILPMLRQRNPQAAAAGRRRTLARARRPRRPAARGDDARRPAPVPRVTAIRRGADAARGADRGVQSTTWCRWSSSESGSRCLRTRPWCCCGSRPGATASCRSTSARPEATSIHYALEGVDPAAPADPRPVHPDARPSSASQLEQIVVTEIRDHTYFAELHLRRGERRRHGDLQPAVRCHRPGRALPAPLFASEELLDEVGQDPTPEPRGGGRGDHRRVPRLHRARQPRRLRRLTRSRSADRPWR